MTKTICPTCGAECNKISVPSTIYDPGLERYEMVGETTELRPLPQPDLTKLREIYEECVVLEGPFMRNKVYLIIMQAIKEVLDAETSNSEHSS